MQKFLTDAGISIADAANLPEISASFEFSDKPNSSRSLYTSRATIKLKNAGKEVVLQPQGVGRDAEAAHVKAISNIPVSQISDLAK